MKIIIKLTITTIILMLSMNIQAGNAAAGKTKSADCAGCHGMNGKSTTPTNPNLAGQKEAYLAKSIKAYRDGQRKDPIMSAMVKDLSDTDIADLAAFYSSVK